MDNSVVIVEGGNIRGLNGNGKNTIKKVQKKKSTNFPLKW